MLPFDLPLHAGILPRLLITIVGEPVPGGDRYSNGHSASTDLTYYWLTPVCVQNGGPEGPNAPALG